MQLYETTRELIEKQPSETNTWAYKKFAQALEFQYQITPDRNQ